MLSHTVLHGPRILSPAAASALKARRTQTFRAFYATIRSLRQPPPTVEVDDLDSPDNDFILSLLKANPSLRDTKSYLANFGVRPQTPEPADSIFPSTRPSTSSVPKEAPNISVNKQPEQLKPTPGPIVSSILDPVYRRTALVKLQGPFTNKQLDSIARGMVYLEKLGLVSVIVVENDNLVRGDDGERSAIIEEIMRVARPVLGTVVRLGPKPDDELPEPHDFVPPEAHVFPSDLVAIRSALRAGEIPVLPPFALDSFCRSVRIDANDVLGALARGMAEAAALDDNGMKSGSCDTHEDYSQDINLVPMRLMIISREGGVPSYAREGFPHLLINVNSEYDYIRDTYDPSWYKGKPSSLSNLSLARTCLAYMPPTSSAIMVSHRSPSSLIANLITNKPAVSSSLPHALLQGNRKLTRDTPTLLRRGLPIQVIRSLADVDKTKMNNLLEKSFKRTLGADAFYRRLEQTLDFVVVAGDYVGAAIVTNETSPDSSEPISYLDKFAVLPSHQGDGTVDFLWVALHDESYGLGHPFSINPNGGKEGKGEGRDLVWRSRDDNPVNKWYFERSTGHMRMGSWVLFWCDAEKRLKVEEGRRANAGLSYIEDWEEGRLSRWADVVTKIPSAWK
ncbi:mitochondrial amino-acid acetyltransferase [Suillus paluster]|uniref:mitochondrial amino-acid acetyltransferase n=1 Tax=Suillus paluster TaxID=48578 RepID=UPI001B85FD55|nr:mitochondrial amino-acid acetyltransferase [Suillus paluster]KAG1749840.1 mitochondrial amino-acid acetyltransferase [Suillus paluster]